MINIYFSISSTDILNALNEYDPFENGSYSLSKDSEKLEDELVEFFQEVLEDILVDEHNLLDTILNEILDSGLINEYVKYRFNM
jgi:hypothetical protein